MSALGAGRACLDHPAPPRVTAVCIDAARQGLAAGLAVARVGTRDAVRRELARPGAQAYDGAMTSLSHDLRLLFVHIPKTGGESVREALRPHGLAALPEGLAGHQSASALRAGLPDVFAAYTTFATVRNPWDRAVSLHHYRQRRLQEGLARWPVHWPTRDDVARLGFRDVVLRSAEQDPARRDIVPARLCGETAWLEPACLAWIAVDGEIAVDHVCRMESLDRDVARVARAIGVDLGPLPHVNASRRTHYRDYYDDETREIVGARYAADVEAFGYTF